MAPLIFPVDHLLSPEALSASIRKIRGSDIQISTQAKYTFGWIGLCYSERISQQEEDLFSEASFYLNLFNKNAGNDVRQPDVWNVSLLNLGYLTFSSSFRFFGDMRTLVHSALEKIQPHSPEKIQSRIQDRIKTMSPPKSVRDAASKPDTIPLTVEQDEDLPPASEIQELHMTPSPKRNEREETSVFGVSQRLSRQLSLFESLSSFSSIGKGM